MENQKESPIAFITADDYENEVKTIFELFDFDNSGHLDPQVFQMVFESFDHPIDSMRMKKIEQDCEKKGLSGVPYETFRELYSQTVHPFNSALDLELAYQVIDTDGTNNVNIQKLKAITQKLGFSFRDSQLRDLIRGLSPRHDDHLTLDDVKGMFTA